MTKKQIIERTRYWINVLCCNDQDIDIIFKKLDTKDVDQGDWVGVAVSNSLPHYLESKITFNENKLKLVDDEVIVHEILHIKLSELTGYLYANITDGQQDKWKGYFEERFVSQMAKIITRRLKII